MKCSECGNEIPRGEKHKRRESRPVCVRCWYGEPTPLEPLPMERPRWAKNTAQEYCPPHEGV